MTSITFNHKGQKVDIKEQNSVDVFKSVCDWLYDNGYNFSGDVHNSGGRQIMSIDDINSLNHPISRYYNIKNSGKFISTTMIGNKSVRLRNIILMLENFGINGSKIQHEGFESSSRIKKFGEIDKDQEDEFNLEVSEKTTFVNAAQIILNDYDNIPMTAEEIWQEIESRDLVATKGATPKATLYSTLLKYSNNSNVSKGYKNKIFTIVSKEPVKFKLINNEVQDIEDEEDLDSVLPPSDFIETKISTKTYVKNPFGCKQENGEETSALCVLGKSGSGKTTTTENALELMGHEVLIYIPIEGEYTFSQFTGQGFEMSSLGEFIMMAQNDPGKNYTVIFDECHRPITITKLNTDLLQALSSRRNRGGERFFTMDRSTKRMYTESKEFTVSLKEKSGKVLVPDNFGIVCLSSQPAVICRNEDFLNRVDLVVFYESDRDITDLTELKKLDSKQKNIETIRGLLESDGTR